MAVILNMVNWLVTLVHDVNGMAGGAHLFWLGKINPMIAVAKEQAKIVGSLPKVIKLTSIVKPLFKKYEKVLKKAGREDLLKV